MSYINLDDVESQLRSLQLVLDKPLTFDARIQRWKVEGEDNERRGWSRLKEWTSPRTGARYIVGDYGVWHGTDDGRQRIDLPKRDDPQRPPVSAEDLAAIKAAQKEAAKKLAETRKAEAKTAARWAALVWAACVPAPADHDYLARKGVAAHGLRLLAGATDEIALTGLDDSNQYRLKVAAQDPGALVVPMHDEHGNVVGLQFVYGKGHPRRAKLERDKEFWPSGMAMGGSFGLIGPLRREGVLLIAEGFATAATLFEATGYSVAYAFSANNLVKAGRALRKTCPRARLLFCADDDYQTEGNPGTAYAAQATAEIEHSAWVAPRFTDEAGNDLRNGKKLTDYNDLAALTSAITVAAQINARLDDLKWRGDPMAVSPLSGVSAVLSSNQGGGEVSDAGDHRPAAVSIMTLDDLVARFVPLDDGTGKIVFDQWRSTIALREQMNVLLPAGQRIEDIKRHPVWQTRGAAYMDEVGFDPGGDEPGIKLNTWRGWPLKPAEKGQGSCDLQLELLRYLCSDDPAADLVYRWLLCWMAWPLQNPGAKLLSAIIMHGKQGTGKSTVFKTLARIYGAKTRRNYSVVLDQRALQDSFNAEWENKLFILTEEAVANSDKWNYKNELKELVTGDKVRIRKVFTDAYYQTNRINFVFISNEHFPLPIDNDDRRHLVVWCPTALGQDFYAEVRAEIDSGGVEALYRHLLDIDIPRFCPEFDPNGRPPMTDAKRALIELSNPSEVRFAQEWLAGETRFPVCPCMSEDFYTAYLRWCRINGEARPRASNQFFGALRRFDGFVKKKAQLYTDFRETDLHVKPLIFPPEAAITRDELRFSPDTSESAWRWKCVDTFHKSLSGEQEGGFPS